MMKKHILSLVMTLAFGALWFYFAIPAINLRAPGFWVMLFMMALVYAVSYLVFGGFRRLAAAAGSPFVLEDGHLKKVKLQGRGKIIFFAALGLLVLFLVLVFATSSRVTRASDYQRMLSVVEGNFAEDIAELPISQIPIVDRDTAERLGNRKIGEVVELVSQFNVAEYYSQINYKEKPYRVTPLEYDGLLKWFANKDEGIPYYVTIDMATMETELVELEEGMKYSPSEYFSRDLYRHIRFKYPTKMFENLSFEIDDAGHPFWVMSYYEYTFGIFGGKDIAGIILVDAVSGEMTDYAVDKVPQWIDRVYSAEMLVEQADNWGSLKNGFFNSIFTQKNVVVTTEGYNYIALDDDVWLYTGITSVVADESNIGFILINMRTKEARTYAINGAEEYSAMGSAEEQVQEKDYDATFPILINVANEPTYFISLKGDAGLVKMYAFVSVPRYHIVGVDETIEGARRKYLQMLGVGDTENDDNEDTLVDVVGTVTAIATAVVDGDTVYYIRLDDGLIYTASVKLDENLPFLAVGDSLTAKVNDKREIQKIGQDLPESQ